MTILALNPPGDVIRTGRLVRKSKISTQSWMPIHLAYGVGVLEKFGNECVLHDASVTGEKLRDTTEFVKDCDPEFIAYFWAYDSANEDLKYANFLGNKFNITLVGPWSAHMPDALEKTPNVQAMTFGNFEYTLQDLFTGKPKKSIAGLKYREDGEIFFNPQRKPYTQAELDWMPWVTTVYENHLDFFNYHQTSFRYPFTDLFTALSCPHRCTFCSWTNGCDKLHPNRYVKRSLRSVMDELWYIKNELPQIKQVFLQDSVLPTPRATEISQAMLDEKLKLCWGAYSRADKSYETLSLMKKAGCRTLHVGYEVPIQSILDEIKKDLTVEQEEKFIEYVNKLGMWTSSSFMIFPWMSEEQIKYMVQWIKKNGATRVNVAQLQTYPNVPIADTVRVYQDIPNKHMMDFDEMKKWEQYFFKEFYVKNPKFWWNVITNPREWASVIQDGLGMLGFLFE